MSLPVVTALRLDVVLHCLPPQCNVSVTPLYWIATHPTAHASLLARASTPASQTLWASGGTWPATCAQAEPFQCRIPGFRELYWPPTAQTSLAATPETPRSGPASGLATTLHWVPFQCSVRPLVCGPIPTAQ